MSQRSSNRKAPVCYYRQGRKFAVPPYFITSLRNSSKFLQPNARSRCYLLASAAQLPDYTIRFSIATCTNRRFSLCLPASSLPFTAFGYVDKMSFLILCQCYKKLSIKNLCIHIFNSICKYNPAKTVKICTSYSSSLANSLISSSISSEGAHTNRVSLWLTSVCSKSLLWEKYGLLGPTG